MRKTKARLTRYEVNNLTKEQLQSLELTEAEVLLFNPEIAVEEMHLI